MKRSKRILNRIIGFLLSLSLLAPFVSDALPSGKVQAASKNTVVTYEYYTTVMGNTVPASWLFVGTYLMSAKSLTAELYQAALDSREYYEQPIAFYSSELDGGAWKNIEGASSITTILPVAEKVSEEELYPYFVTVVIEDDGVPRDPVTEEPIDIYTSLSMYDMENIKELKKIYDYYLTGGLSWEDEGSRNYLYRMLYFFFENDDLADFDRASLDSMAAMEQYRALVADRKELEGIWDKALTRAPETWTSEYKEIMQVMRNWPNIRDDYTDRADREEELLGSLYMELQQKELKEEADSALFVERQIDASRRARIYYNLTANENLTGSYGASISDELEKLELDLAELNARIAQLALDIDKAEMPVKQARAAIYELEASNEAEENAIEEENSRWTERAAEEELERLNEELDVINGEFAPIKAEYDRLNAELDSIYNESMDYDAQQKALADEIDALINSKEDKKKECDEKIKKLESDLLALKSRSAKGEARKAEYEEKKLEAVSLNASIDRLKDVIDTENKNLEKLKDKADSYTTSRTTAEADTSKTYDPAKKQEADNNVKKQEKLLVTLNNSLAAAEGKLQDVRAVVDEIEPDLNLSAEIEELEKSVSANRADLPKILDRELAEIDIKVAGLQDDLAAMSGPYQEKLKRLKAANDAYEAYFDTYKAKKSEYDDKKAAISAVEAEIRQHDALIRQHEDKIEANNELSATKELIVKNDQIPVDTLNEEYEALVKERDSLEGVIEKAREGGISPYTARIKALNLKLDELETRLKSCLANKISYDISNAALKQKKKETENRLNAANRKKDAELKAEYDDKIAQIESEYEKLISEAEGLREETSASMRDDLLDLERSIADDAELASKKQELMQADEAVKNARELETVTQAYYRYKRDNERFKINLEILEIQLKNLKESWGIFSVIQGRIRQLENDIWNLHRNIDLSEQYMQNAWADMEKLKALCTDYYPSVDEEKSVTEYVRQKTAERDGLDKEVRDIKNALDASYDSAKKRWEAELERCDTGIEDLIRERDKQIADAGTALEEDMKQISDQIVAITKDLNSVSTKKAALEGKISDNKKEIDSLNKEIEETREQISLYQERERILREADNFGVAPTLKFLEDASLSGKPGMGRRYEDMSAYDGEGAFEEIGELTGIIQDAIKACEASYDSYMKKSMQRGETAADYTGYILSRRVAALAGDEAKVLPYLQMITDLRNIENGEQVHVTREISLLYTWLLPFAISDFNKQRTVAAMDDYHYYLVEVTDRDTPENGIIYVEDRLEYAKSIKSSFINGGRQELIESHIAFLEGLLQSLRSRLSDDGTDKDLDEYERELMEEKEHSLEDGDLVRAKMIDALLQGLIEERENEAEEPAEGEDNEDDLQPTDSDPNERPVPDEEIVEVILDEINDPAYDIDKDLDKLSGFPGGVGDLAQALKDDGEGDKYDKKIEDVLAGSADGTGNNGTGKNQVPGGTAGSGSNTGSGSGSGTSSSGGEGGTGGGSGPDGGGTGGQGSSGSGQGGTGTGSGPDGGNTDGSGSGNGGASGAGSGDGSGGSGNGSVSPGADGSGGSDGRDGSGGAGSGGRNGSSGNGDMDTGSGNSGKGGGGGSDKRTPGGGEGYDEGVSDLDKGKVKAVIDPVFKAAGPDDKAAIVAALSEAAQISGNDDIGDYARELLDELLRDANSNIYRQYMSDKTREYVSLAAMDRCRVKSGFRYVRRGVDVTMSQLYTGSASYTFTVGQKSIKKNNGEEGTLKANCAEQTDRYIRGDSSAKYAYITEDDSFRYMGCDCVYIKTTDWAVLITPSMDKQIREIATILNEMADRGEFK